MPKEEWEIALENATAKRSAAPSLTREQVEDGAKRYDDYYKRMRGFVRAEIGKVSTVGSSVEIAASVDADEITLGNQDTQLQELIVNGVLRSDPSLRSRLDGKKWQLLLKGFASQADALRIRAMPLSVTAIDQESRAIEGVKSS